MNRLSSALIVLVLALTSVQASTPKFFQAQTQADFLRGDVENLSIDVNGQLVLGPATELVYETAAPFLWSLLAAGDGSLFVGTGNEGKVFRIDSQGRGSVFFDSAELEVHALAPAPDGGLYVATSPDGKIYKVDRGGAATTFFDPDDKYIWSLAVDAKGNVYAGTGEKGVIYKIAADGKGAPFYRTNATHATALTIDKAGNSFRRHRLARAGAAHRSGGQTVRAARFAVSGDSHPPFRRQGRALRRVRRTAVRPADRRRHPTTAVAIRPRFRAPRQSRRFPSRPRSPPSRSWIPRAAQRRRATIRAASRAGSTGLMRTVSGISSGNRARIRRTT